MFPFNKGKYKIYLYGSRRLNILFKIYHGNEHPLIIIAFDIKDDEDILILTFEEMNNSTYRAYYC